ncbi:ACP S-malonyltransferase [Massilia sp. W12]|uniref:ACP S-malonyltransferase n=1 Tax=Massilia sp. W12 TaxID=3126507 RepID=UPI0030CB375F
MKNFAFVFPGQGSQAVGMLNGFADNQAVAQTVAQASDILRQDLAQLIAQGPKEELDITTNTQPLMLTAGVAFFRAWQAAGGALPNVVAGHSLGEYAALVAAGVLQFEDALPLVRYRAGVMQEAVPLGAGGMAVVLGLSDEAVQQACAAAQQACPGQVVEAVNFNAPAQVVIAGHNEALDAACAKAKELGAKRAMRLPVSAPFHSSLLQPASQKLQAYMQDISFSAPQIPLINNVDVCVEFDPAAIRAALVRQAASPVRWVETLQAMDAMGVTHVIECGPGKVLHGLNKRIVPEIVSDALLDADSMARIAALLAD